ncbi:hypothetical protein EIP91_001454 [Steccherinum ochraceum]|uniref:Haloacid dehalogenase, type II n=1 Tax=Steccherinum ochraceum TaxID=92696 RepID=A0A4R0RDW7_9APHY|nr:hypothetical protein EIP91_001454 [Steccherinum ochraceum]
MANILDVEALLFDVFGTVVNWKSSVIKQLAQSHGIPEDILAATPTDWDAFAVEWRTKYYQQTKKVSESGIGSTNIDVVHRQLLDEMLETPRWQHLSAHWGDKKREEMTRFWHKLDGWEDSSRGLYSMKKDFILGTLSNGSARLLVDLHADLPWDIVFSGDIIGSFKTNPKMYLGAVEKLDLKPHKVAMVAAHRHDLVAAATHGMKTVYVRRPTEDAYLTAEEKAAIKPRADGGEFDLVVNSLTELAQLLESPE